LIFKEKKNNFFNILSDPYVSLNSLFSDPTNNKHKYITYMTTYGFEFADLNVVIQANLTDGRIFSNGSLITLQEDTETKLSDCVYGLFIKGEKHNYISIQTNREVFSITLISGLYLNLDVKLNRDDLTTLGGILGLTESEDFDNSTLINDDFIENSLFSSNSKYNTYKSAKLDCSANDVVNTFSPSQMHPQPKVVPKTMNAHVLHNQLTETFSTK